MSMPRSASAWRANRLDKLEMEEADSPVDLRSVLLASPLPVKAHRMPTTSNNTASEMSLK